MKNGLLNKLLNIFVTGVLLTFNLLILSFLSWFIAFFASLVGILYSAYIGYSRTKSLIIKENIPKMEASLRVALGILVAYLLLLVLIVLINNPAKVRSGLLERVIQLIPSIMYPIIVGVFLGIALATRGILSFLLYLLLALCFTIALALLEVNIFFIPLG